MFEEVTNRRLAATPAMSAAIPAAIHPRQLVWICTKTHRLAQMFEKGKMCH